MLIVSSRSVSHLQIKKYQMYETLPFILSKIIRSPAHTRDKEIKAYPICRQSLLSTRNKLSAPGAMLKTPSGKDRHSPLQSLPLWGWDHLQLSSPAFL